MRHRRQSTDDSSYLVSEERVEDKCWAQGQSPLRRTSLAEKPRSKLSLSLFSSNSRTLAHTDTPTEPTSRSFYLNKTTPTPLPPPSTPVSTRMRFSRADSQENNQHEVLSEQGSQEYPMHVACDQVKLSQAPMSHGGREE